MPPPVYGAVTTVDKAAEYRLYFSKTLLEHQINTLQLYPLGYKATIPKGQGSKTIRLFRAPPADITQVLTLTEGTPPSNNPYKLTYEYVTRTLSQYGGYAQVSDIVDETEFLNTGESLMTKFGEEASLWADTLIRNACIQGTTEEPTKFTRRYAGTAVDYTTLQALTGATGHFSTNDLIDVCTEMRLNKAKEFDDGFFAAVVSPEQERDLIQEQGNAWTYASAFQKPDQIWKGELGRLFGVKVLRGTNPMYQTTTEATPAAGVPPLTPTTVIASLVFGKDAFAVPALEAETPTAPKVMTITTPDSANPFNQFYTYSWKTFFNAMATSTWNGVVLQTLTSYTPT
jgi:N4-gp56 family major capsid protein